MIRTPAVWWRGPTGNVWFTELYDDAVVRVTPAGSLTTFPLSEIVKEGNPNYITVGADGALWFTVDVAQGSDTGQGIGRITTAGQVKFWPIPTISGEPASLQDIAPGTGRTLWFTYDTRQSDGIGRVSLADPSAVTAFPLGHATGPLTIVAGAGGAHWFTEESGGKIGTISANGSVRTVAVPTLDGRPFGLAPSPGGGYWFTEYAGNRVGQISATGKVTECPAFSRAATSPTFIVSKDGTYWAFLTGKPSRLVSVSPDCKTRQWPLPDGPTTAPWYLASGPGGALWFTQDAPAAVGQITLAPAWGSAPTY